MSAILGIIDQKNNSRLGLGTRIPCVKIRFFHGLPAAYHRYAQKKECLIGIVETSEAAITRYARLRDYSRFVGLAALRQQAGST
ncbi:hypothetical protein TNCV_3646901 [Trichonephila clavipes]|nr:hypothetical protein TNCV_3646901 [Trichonephila clavipes]